MENTLTTFRTGQIRKILKIYFNVSTDSALLKIFETMIDYSRVLTFTGDSTYLTTEIGVIHFELMK